MTHADWSETLLGSHAEHEHVVHQTELDDKLVVVKASLHESSQSVAELTHDIDDTSDNNVHETIEQSAERAKFASELRVCGVSFSWIFLFFIAVIRFGPYWVYDLPGALYIEFQEWFNRPNEQPVYTAASQAFMYGIYSWPNLVLPFISGILIDRVIGIRWSSALFATIIVIGQIIFSIGIAQADLFVGYVGRCVLGVGGESLTIAQNTLVVRWFDGTALALAFGLVQSFARLGTAVAFIVSPIVAEDQSLTASLIVSIVMCVVSWACCVFAGFGDRIAQKAMDRSVANHLSVNHLEGDEIVDAAVSTRFRLSDLKLLGLSTWLLMIINALMSVSASTFRTVAQDLYVNTGPMMSPAAADRAISTIAFTAIFACPLWGVVLDRFGRTLSFLLVSTILMFLAHLAILAQVFNIGVFVDMGPYPVMLLTGIAFSIPNTAVWPALSHSIDDSRVLATAFGIGTAVQNAALAGFPQLIASLRARCATAMQEYVVLMLVFLSVSGFAIYFSVWLLINDRTHGGKLNAGKKMPKPVADEDDNQELLTAKREDLFEALELYDEDDILIM